VKTEQEIEALLRRRKLELEKIRKRFNKYDNYDDLKLIDALIVEIGALGWVLGGKDNI